MANGQIITDYIAYGAGAPSTPPSLGVSGQWSLYQDTDTGDLYAWDLESTAWAAIAGGSTPDLACAHVAYVGSNVTITATTWTAIDSSLTLSLTTGAHRVQVSFILHGYNYGAGQGKEIDVAIDGTRVGGTLGLAYAANPETDCIAPSFLTDVLTAGTHTFELLAETSAGGTFVIQAGTDGLQVIFDLQETLFTT